MTFRKGIPEGPFRPEVETIVTPRQLAVTCARIADEKKASDIVLLDLRKLNTITDYFVICTAQNERQSRAIADGVTLEMKRLGIPLRSANGPSGGTWILEDYGDFVVHVFLEERRQFYDLDGHWADAPKVDWARARGAARAPRSPRKTGTGGA